MSPEVLILFENKVLLCGEGLICQFPTHAAAYHTKINVVVINTEPIFAATWVANCLLAVDFGWLGSYMVSVPRISTEICNLALSHLIFRSRYIRRDSAPITPSMISLPREFADLSGRHITPSGSCVEVSRREINSYTDVRVLLGNTQAHQARPNPKSPRYPSNIPLFLFPSNTS